MARLLVVDDDHDLREILSECLMPHFSEVDVVASGEQALRALQNQHYDLVVTDMNMPQMSGLDLLRIIRQKYNEMDVCILTGGMSEEDKAEILTLKVSAIFDKPFDFKEIIRKIEWIIDFEQVKKVA